VLRRQRNATVLLDEVVGVDAAAHRVATRFGTTQSYDYVILATGSQYNYFGHDDWPRLAPGLKSIDDATLIRRRLLLAFEEAETATDRAIRRRLLTLVLVGGGPTGVEMAGAVAELAHATLSRDFRHIDPHTAHILLVEAGPRVLAGFPEKLADLPGIPSSGWGSKRCSIRRSRRSTEIRVLDGPLQMAVRAFDGAVLVRQAPIVAGRLHAVMSTQRPRAR
jgi:NADH dehydrogenase FAD-containing subunit